MVFRQDSFLFYLHNRIKPKLISGFGIFWDRNNNPVCPKCDNILTDYIKISNDPFIRTPYFYCHKCESNIYLKDENGNTIDYKDAINKFKSG